MVVITIINQKAFEINIFRAMLMGELNMFKIGFLERYRARKEWDTIQKSRPVKYIRRYPKASGKGWNYVYKDSWKHPFKALLECFGIKQKRIDDDYTGNNIKKDYGVDKKTFAAHVLEYFVHKAKWDYLFSKRDNQEKHKKPVKCTAENKIKSTTTDSKKADIDKKKFKPNTSLMRKIWTLYSVEGKKIDVAGKHEENNSDFVNNLETATQAYNKRKLTKPGMLKKHISQILKYANSSTTEVDDYNSLDEYVSQLTKWNEEYKKAGVNESYDFEKAGRTYAKIANKSTAREIYEAYKNGEYELDTNGTLQKRDTSAITEALKGNQNAKGHNGNGGGGGNKGNVFKFSSLTDKEKTEMGTKIQSSVVSEIGKDTIPHKEGESFSKTAKEWIKNNPQGNAETFIGEVVINEKSAEKDLYHGDVNDLYLKLQTLPSIKDILEKGTYLGYEKDFDGKPIDNHYFAGKIKYGAEEKIVFCSVHENAGDKNRFYVYEVFTEDEIKKGATMHSSNDSLQRLTGKPLYSFILQDVLKIKEKPQTQAEGKQ